MIHVKIHRTISSFGQDLLDRLATTSKHQFRLPDIWGTILIVLSGGATFVEAINKVNVFGVPGAVFPALLLLFGLAWCIHVIVAKVEQSTESKIILMEKRSTLEMFYSYGQPVRYLAKIGLPILLFLISQSLFFLYDDLRLLPTTFSGYLIDATDGTPIADASIRVVSEEGVDVTKGIWLTDSEGFYIIETIQRVNSKATIAVRWPNCSEEQYLLLRRIDELRTLPEEVTYSIPSPTFKHVINCGGTQ